MSITFEKFTEPIIKSHDNVRKGDVIYTEYGDFNNYVTVAVDSVDTTGEWVKTTGRYVNSGELFEGFQHVHRGKGGMFKVIGKEI